MCELAIKEKDIVINEKQIEEKEKRIETNLREIDTIKVFLEGSDVITIIYRDLDFLKHKELKIAKEKETKINDNIEKMKYQLANYEDYYFADL